MATTKDSFTHDYRARENLIRVQMALGLEGIGLYWCLVEIMHERGGGICVEDLDCIAYDLHTDVVKVKKLIYEFGLFQTDDLGYTVHSARVQRNLGEADAACAGKRAAAAKRWNKAKEQEPAKTPVETVGEVSETVDSTPSPENALVGKETGETDYCQPIKEFILRKLQKLEPSDPLSGDSDRYWQVEPMFRNLVEFIKDPVSVEGKPIPLREYLGTIHYYVDSFSHLLEAKDIFTQSNRDPTICNKRSYIRAALYLNAKINGG